VSIEAFTPADLAVLLDGEPPGEAEEALAGLLGDEWEEVYPPAAQAELRARLDAAGWPEPFARCPACQTVFLRRFRPDTGRCRECASLLAPRQRLYLAPEPSSPPPTRTWGEAPAESNPAWTLAESRGLRAVPSEEGLDFLQQREEELLEIAARTQAADWLGGGEHDPSDEVAALPLAPTERASAAQAAATPEGSQPLAEGSQPLAEGSQPLAEAPDARTSSPSGPSPESEPGTLAPQPSAPAADVAETLEAGPAETHPDQVGPDQVGPGQAGPDRIGPDQADSARPLVEVEAPALSESDPSPLEFSDSPPREELGAERGATEPSSSPAPPEVLDPSPAPAVQALASQASESALLGAAPAELREETGRRAGRVHTLALGSSFRIGTARRGEVVLRQRGVAFKHAEVQVAEDGSATLSDLGTGQTWLGDELLSASEVRTLSSGDLVRCGEATLLVTLHQARVQAPAPIPAEGTSPQAPWKPPSAAEVAAARHTPPSQILAALPASQLDLVARAARAIPLPRWRAAQPRAERAFVDHDAEAFAQLARGVLDGRYLPGDAGTWLRWEEDEGSVLCRSALEDGATVILAPWDLLARLPEPLPGSGPGRVGRFLELLLPRNTGRLVAEEEGELAGGFWRCRYASRAGLCAGRFSSIEARSNGHVLTATLTPRFPLQSASPSFAEDPLESAMGDLRDRPAWRPPPRGQGAPAPHVPRGGRHRERRRPSRSRARDHYR